MYPRFRLVILTAPAGVRSRGRRLLPSRDYLDSVWYSFPRVGYIRHCKNGLRLPAEGLPRGVVGDGAT